MVSLSVASFLYLALEKEISLNLGLFFVMTKTKKLNV